MSGQTRVEYQIAARSFVCPDHYEFGPIMACPFPGCPHGVATDEILVDLFQGEETFRRAVWTNHEGAPSYSWVGLKKDALFLAIKRTFWRDAVRLGIIEPFDWPPPPLYQYTSLAGFLGIIQSGEIWLSDYAYLDDATELSHGLELARTSFEAAAEARPASEHVLRRWGNAQIDQHRVCVASFSYDGDSLSQWRAYGPVAVGFRPEPLAFGYSNSSQMKPVIYDMGVQRRLLDLLAHLTASAHEYDLSAWGDKTLDLYRDGADWVLDLVAFFKNPGFVDEREVRIVHSESPAVYERLPMERPPKRFRVSGDLIVPYVTTKDIARKHPDRLPIEEVVIGPSPSANTLRMGVLEVLRTNGYPEVPVRTSGTPFRR